MDNWQKQVRILWWSQLIAITAMEMSEPFWPLFLRQLSPNTANIEIWSAIIYGAPLLVSGLIAPLWGRLGDRYGHKPMLLRASLGLALTQCLLYFSSSLWEVLIYRLLQGALAGVITAVLCFASSITPHQSRSVVVGKLTSATAAGAILGPLAGGVLIEWFNFQMLFASASIVCLAIAVLLAVTLDGNVKPTPTATKAATNATNSKHGQIIGLFLLVILLLQIAKAIPSSFFALYTEQHLASTPLITGLLFSAAGVGMMISAPYWGRLFDQMGNDSGTLLLALIAAIASLCYLLHLQTSWLSLLLVRFAWGICLGAMLPMIQATMISLNQHQQGLIIGKAQRTIKLGNLAGVGGGALLLTWWDYQSGFAIAAAVYLCAAVSLVSIWQQLAKQPDRASPVEE